MISPVLYFRFPFSCIMDAFRYFYKHQKQACTHVWEHTLHIPHLTDARWSYAATGSGAPPLQPLLWPFLKWKHPKGFVLNWETTHHKIHTCQMFGSVVSLYFYKVVHPSPLSNLRKFASSQKIPFTYLKTLPSSFPQSLKLLTFYFYRFTYSGHFP